VSAAEVHALMCIENGMTDEIRVAFERDPRLAHPVEVAVTAVPASTHGRRHEQLRQITNHGRSKSWKTP
jgi:hypothetical protein